MMEWEQAKARLERIVTLSSMDVDKFKVADVRAALQRVEELEREREATRERFAHEQRQHHEFMVLANGFRASARRFAAGEISGTKLGELLLEPDPVAFGRGLQSTLEDESRTRAEAAESDRERLRRRVEELEKQLEDMVGMDPCPKCGQGISATCLGCEIKEAQAEVRRLEVENAADRLSLGLIAEGHRTEVRRLEGLIVDWSEGRGTTDSFSTTDLLEVEARRIREREARHG